jgi:hypothetical protein
MGPIKINCQSFDLLDPTWTLTCWKSRLPIYLFELNQARKFVTITVCLIQIKPNNLFKSAVCNDSQFTKTKLNPAVPVICFNQTKPSSLLQPQLA